jgi:ABC-type multidrug transport system permease subunit
MKNLLNLYLGEFNRYIKYNLLAASLLLIVAYGAIFYFLDKAIVTNLLSVFLFFEIFVMPMLFLGVEFYYEKQEGTLKTMLAAPVSKYQILGSKYLMSISAALISFTLLVLIAYLMYQITPNIIELLTTALISLVFSVATGILLSYVSLDFSKLFVNYIILVLAMYLPVVVYQFNFYRAEWFKVLIDLLPPQSINLMLEWSYGRIAFEDIYLNIIYILGLGIGLSIIAIRNFDKFAAK